MFVTRPVWGARRRRGGPGALDPDLVEGIALHWPAMTKPLRGVGPVSAALRSWQAYHQDTLGWSDIGYQEAVDQDGNVYQLRGLSTQSGANGNQDVNERFGALLLVLAPGEEPTAAMVRAVRRRIAEHRERFPRSRRIVGHQDVRPEPTACPGPAVMAAIRAGRFDPDRRRRRKPNRVQVGRQDLQAAVAALESAASHLAQVPDSRHAAHAAGARAVHLAGMTEDLLERMPNR